MSMQVWALGALGELQPALLSAAARRLASLPPSAVNARDLRSFYQADLLLQAKTGEQRSHLPPKLAAEALAAWRMGQRPRRGALEASVGAALERIGGFTFATDCTIAEDAELRVDFLVQGSLGQRIAVEVLKPSVFAANDPHHMLGKVQLMQTLLLAGGVDAVVGVPHWEWAALEGEPGREEAYLRDALKQHLQPKSSQSGSHAVAATAMAAAQT